ncbi:NAD(P)H-dependent oxidoreductase [Fibrivirga algicola]|uniref:NAD(P)H-dependent oxidoreductase n=1 Tax=Fibrivirga algicola TaxID=2950420 RepID=A0ABX0QA06_9BACT|nr:NAD(P)H-dependent oxidoreductase [Fibrivirga algicola]NID09039.1 NAD(P)H-dependent oxidoreductase [Fibrivirga algicola]
MRIAIISTSPRANSNTLRFCKFVQNVLEESGQHEVTVVDFAEYDLPYVGTVWMKPDTLTTFQDAFISAWGEADLVFFASPEYNWTATPQILNAFHSLGGPAFKHLFENKVFAMAGISNGRGGRQPALDMTTVLNKVISFTNSFSIISPKLYESHETDKNLDADGQFVGHEVYDRTARAFIEYTLTVAQRWNCAPVAVEA